MIRRIIIAGSRTFTDQAFVDRKLDQLLRKFLPAVSGAEKIRILSGAARGVDRLGENWAYKRGIVCERFHAEWSKYGKAAGPKRNEEMAKTAHALIAFWYGREEGGTWNMIQTARRYRLKIKIVRIEGDSL